MSRFLSCLSIIRIHLICTDKRLLTSTHNNSNNNIGKERQLETNSFGGIERYDVDHNWHEQ